MSKISAITFALNLTRLEGRHSWSLPTWVFAFSTILMALHNSESMITPDSSGGEWNGSSCHANAKLRSLAGSSLNLRLSRFASALRLRRRQPLFCGRLVRESRCADLPQSASHIGRVRPDAILARSNAGVIANVLRCLAQNQRCAVVGGTKELERVLADVERLKQGQPTTSPELVGFGSWKDVMSFSSQPEGEGLRALVNLVREHGEGRMLQALSRCELNEETAQVICSTAHRSKGREWNYVHLDPDFESGFVRALRLGPSKSPKALAAESRLVYVALTRAKLGVHLPREIAKQFGIRSTTDRTLGVPL